MKRDLEAHVGIYWWLLGRRLVVFSCPMSQVPVEVGVRDYPKGHDEMWLDVKRLVPRVGEREYFSCPRGRVLWIVETRVYRVLGPSVLMARPRVVAKIVRQFHLPSEKVEVVADEHYNSACAADSED